MQKDEFNAMMGSLEDLNKYLKPLGQGVSIEYDKVTGDVLNVVAIRVPVLPPSEQSWSAYELAHGVEYVGSWVTAKKIFIDGWELGRLSHE